MLLLRWDIKGRVPHIKRLENPLLEKFIKLRTGYDLDKPPENICRKTIFPRRPRLMLKRKRTEFFHCVCYRLLIIAQHLSFYIHLVYLRGCKKSVSQARCMTQQVPDRYFPLCRHSSKRLLACLRVRLFNSDFKSLKLRNIFRDRFVKEKTSLFIKHHNSRTGNRLGHRIDAKDCIFFHRQPVFNVTHTEGFKIPRLPIAGDKRRSSGNPFFANILLYDPIDLFKTLSGQAHRLRAYNTYLMLLTPA